MKRAAQFLRSVIPADPAQLVFLAGALLLLIVPRLSWRSDVLVQSSNPLYPRWPRDFLEVYLFTVACNLGVLTAGLVAFYACFWPGRTPLRRIIFGVLLPASIALALMVWKLFEISEGTSSILDKRSAVAHLLSWTSLHFWKFPAGVYFLLIGLILISIYAFRLASGASSLPLTLSGDFSSIQGNQDQWRRTKLLSFVLIGLISLLTRLPSALAGAILYLPFAHGFTGAAVFVIVSMTSVLDAVLILGLSYYILGKRTTVIARQALRLPELRFALLAAVLPVVVFAILPIAQFFYDRAHWAAYYFGKYSPPQFSDYMAWSKLVQPWVFLLVFGAFAEEIIFRGILLPDLIKRYSLHRGIFLTGIAWAAIHFRSDSYAGLGVGDVLLSLLNRILFCLAMNYVLAWMTLRWKSIVPSGIAHTVWNMLVFAPVASPSPMDAGLRFVSWMALAYLLFRYWPVNVELENPSEILAPSPEPAV
jgi:membrane protease YdiL (CAAX protease family)